MRLFRRKRKFDGGFRSFINGLKKLAKKTRIFAIRGHMEKITGSLGAPISAPNDGP